MPVAEPVPVGYAVISPTFGGEAVDRDILRFRPNEGEFEFSARCEAPPESTAVLATAAFQTLGNDGADGKPQYPDDVVGASNVETVELDAAADDFMVVMPLRVPARPAEYAITLRLAAVDAGGQPLGPDFVHRCGRAVVTESSDVSEPRDD